MSASSSSPTIAALFRVVFDQKVGYTIAWHRTQHDDDHHAKRLLDGVEFKSLPSGLHQVQQDVVYFTHSLPDGGERYVGISAFVQREGDEQHRHAEFTSVGALVLLNEHNGRMGRAWELRSDMERLASQVIALDTEPAEEVLEHYWKDVERKKRISRLPTDGVPLNGRSAAASKGKKSAGHEDEDAAMLGERAIGAEHPSLSMPSMLRTFGPLLFPLYRAALLRKRILFLGSPPVLEDCNHVYALSVLSVLPPELREIVKTHDKEHFTVLPSLFSVGVHDIPDLEKLNRHLQSLEKGWIATSTDGILGTKGMLWDMCIEMPPTQDDVARATGKRRWPKLRFSDGSTLKANQRDLRRWRILSRELERVSKPGRERYRDEPDTAGQGEGESEPLITAADHEQHEGVAEGVGLGPEDVKEVVDPSTWAQVAYTSMRWFTSASEMSALEQAEIDADRQLLPDQHKHTPQGHNTDDTDALQAEAAIMASFFHNLTILTLQTMHTLVQEADEGSHDEFDSACDLNLTNDDLQRLGMDGGKDEDCIWVMEMVKKWFGRTADIDLSKGWEVCGVRIC